MGTIETLGRLNQAYLDVLDGKLDRRALLFMGTSFRTVPQQVSPR